METYRLLIDQQKYYINNVSNSWIKFHQFYIVCVKCNTITIKTYKH